VRNSAQMRPTEYVAAPPRKRRRSSWAGRCCAGPVKRASACNPKTLGGVCGAGRCELCSADSMAFASRRIARSTGFVRLDPEQRSQFLHQLGCIGVAVRHYGVGRSCFQHFFLRARNLEGEPLSFGYSLQSIDLRGAMDEAGTRPPHRRNGTRLSHEQCTPTRRPAQL
jgi:hypothetical protein